jgi:hypothetical protein
MRKIVIVILALVVALGALPVSFACYNGGWGHWNHFWRPRQPVYCCPTNCNLTFISVNAGDNEEGKDVGDTTASITCCGKKLTITVDNAYPGYEGIVNFCIRNTGSMAATITGIAPNYPDPELLQIYLNEGVQEGTVISPCSPKWGQLVIGGLAQEGTQSQHFTFDITIDYNCTCVPDKCETAYAYYPAYCGYYAHCFLKCYQFEGQGYSFKKWGWTNGPLGDGDYEFDIYAGAAQCDRWRGKKVGYLTVDYDDSTATVTYNITYPGYKMTETHLYIGNEPWPRKNGDGDFSVAPGDYPYHDADATLVTDTKVIYVIPVNGGDIYIIAHAVVCR